MRDDMVDRACHWTWNNSLPYLVAATLPTVMLIWGYLPPVYWTVLFGLLMVGVGVVDMRSVDIAGQTIRFSEEHNQPPQEAGENNFQPDAQDENDTLSSSEPSSSDSSG